jgi:hypothetical protein
MSRRHLAQGVVGARDDIGGVIGVSGQDSGQRGAEVRKEGARVVRQPPCNLEAGEGVLLSGAADVIVEG